jgi:hypothetical protein
MPNKPLNLIVRGHTRSSLDDLRLLSLVARMEKIFEIHMYVQTWKIVQNNLSWRRVDTIEKEVTEQQIRNYFQNREIKSISILDDSTIDHVGNIEGNIGKTPCPIVAWKNMYYGMMDASSRVLDFENPNSITLQIRFDMLSNNFSPSENGMIEFAEREYSVLEGGNEGDERLRFMRMECFLGVDNTFMATASDMNRFINYMYYDMDRILDVHKLTFHQEYIAFHERKSFLNFEAPKNSKKDLV